MTFNKNSPLKKVEIISLTRLWKIKIEFEDRDYMNTFWSKNRLEEMVVGKGISDEGYRNTFSQLQNKGQRDRKSEDKFKWLTRISELLKEKIKTKVNLETFEL